MTEMLRRTINQFKDMTGRLPSLVILHKSAPFHEDEIEAIHDIALKYGIKYSLVTLKGITPIGNLT